MEAYAMLAATLSVGELSALTLKTQADGGSDDMAEKASGRRVFSKAIDKMFIYSRSSSR
jgi:hypothetical protein